MVTFALGRSVWPQYIPYRRQTDANCTNSATVSTVRSAKEEMFALNELYLTTMYRMGCGFFVVSLIKLVHL